MTDVLIDARRGAGSSLEILYGTVTWKPTLTHSRGTSIVLPAPTTYDLVDGQVVATNVQPSPDPVGGQVEWAYEVTFKDRHSKSYSFLVGVPDSTSQVNFIDLPRYFETKPPLFGQGPQGVPGESATVAVGTVAGGTEASVTNSGTNTDAVLDFVLPQGPQGPAGDGVNFQYSGTEPKVFSDGPDTYPAGVTEGLYLVTDAGWPTFGESGGFVKVITHRHNAYPAASFQIIAKYKRNSKPLVRQALTDTTWGEVKEQANTDTATDLANGLMSSADKSKLDGMTPSANSKAFSAQPSAYPVGFHTIQVDTTGEWPVATSAQVVTFKTSAGDANTTQWIYPVEGTAPQFRVADATGVWGALQEMATRSYVDSKATGINVKAFGAVGDGVALDSPAIYAAFEAATTLGLPLDIPKGTYLMNGFLEIPSGSEIRMSPGCVLDFSGSGATYHFAVRGVLGEPLTTGTFTKGERVLAIPSSGLVANDWIRINSDDEYDPSSTSTTLGELVQVLSVSDTEVTLASPLRDSYSTNVRIYPVTPVKDVVISGGTIKGNFTPNTNKTGIYMSLVVNGEINGTKTEGIDRSHISIIDCVNVWTRDTKHIWANHDNQAYGVSFADCTRNSGTTRGWFSDVRHALSTNNSSLNGGIVRDITFSYSTVQYTSLALAGGSGGDALDTHTAAEDIKILFNDVMGSSLQGINFECTSGTIQGNIVRNTQSTGISVHNESGRVGKIRVIDNEVEFAGSGGISVRAGSRGGVTTRYESIVVTGNSVSDVTGVGIRVGFATTAYERGAVVANNTVTRSTGVGLNCTLIDGLASSGNTLINCLDGGILYDRIIYGSLGPDVVRQISGVEGTPYIAIDCISVTRSSLRPGAIRASGEGNRGVRIASTCEDMAVLGTSHIFAGVKVENLGGSTVIVSN